MGEVVQLRDFQQPKDLARMNKELEQQAVKVLAQAFDGVRDDNIALELSAERIWRKVERNERLEAVNRELREKYQAAADKEPA